MENKGKGPDELLALFERAYDVNNPPDTKFVAEWLRTSMADLLRWSAEQMPHEYGKEHDYDDGRSDGIIDCKATLLRLADEICPK